MLTQAMTLRSFRLAAAALLLFAAPARAQVLVGYLLGEKLSSPTFNIGFELGVNFANLDGLDGADRVTKPVFGLFADWRFSEHFHLGGAFLPLYSRGAKGITPVLLGDSVTGEASEVGQERRQAREDPPRLRQRQEEEVRWPKPPHA